MRTKNTVIGALIPLIQSQWIQPALVAVAVVVTVIGVTGCTPHH